MHDYQLGLAALRDGDERLAETAFESALSEVEVGPGNGDSALRARGFWREELGDTFVGDPYERVMAYFYRGFLHLRAANYAQASAAFDMGAWHDEFAEELQLQSDFHLMALLSAWSLFLNGDIAWQERLFQFNEDTKLNLWFADESCLALIESGTAPRKIRDGVGGVKKVYRRGRNIVPEQTFVSHPSGFIAYPVYVEDIFQQARTRGAHEVSAVDQGWVRFVDQEAAARELGARVQTFDETTQNVVGGTLASLDPSGVASGLAATWAVVEHLRRDKPGEKSDIRAWSNLPDKVSVFLFPCEAGEDGLLEARYVNSLQSDLGIGLPLPFDSATRTDMAGPEPIQ